ncbi:hypothetical protein BAUCODRAFT_242792 [Baudoinia panamericana UAMH 10762]|uniref:Uncharacterized protein n=1 Tax=Baudoinia panamericana (strain UAMH 10762) TaxID=717646 RepID=M2MAI1_BAUPA|nr:uncharacterized protein BAUCODRAFT_242792 [Baudoinia panamericana UAMH 10762]EMC93476.1 hypothetical protein BAUCODRAFT_242792 [Baudoinia panamericana UAMH 10762]
MILSNVRCNAPDSVYEGELVRRARRRTFQGPGVATAIITCELDERAVRLLRNSRQLRDWMRLSGLASSIVFMLLSDRVLLDEIVALPSADLLDSRDCEQTFRAVKGKVHDGRAVFAVGVLHTLYKPTRRHKESVGRCITSVTLAVGPT